MDVKLVMFRTSGQRKDFPVVNPVTVIGRGENCDLRVPLLSVSRRHCELRLAGQAVKVKDLASSNGTYVNNSRVTEVDLRAGDRLAVGPIVFTLQVDGRPEEIRPVKTKGQKMAEAGAAAGSSETELDPDVVAQPGASALENSSDEVDPIAALEALASEPPPKKEPPAKKGK